MKNVLILLVIIIAVGRSNAQELTFKAPDYNSIEKDIRDSTSIFYYPILMSRLIDYDSTLTLEDYRHLYFGYVFQKEYKPYWTSSQEKELIKYYQAEEVDPKDYDHIIDLATKSINEFPFDLRQLNYLSYIYHLKGDTIMLKKVSNKFGGIMDAIMSSGDGKICETAFHVISVGHEYVMLNLFEFEFKSQSLTGNCDYLSLIKDDRNFDGLYFNVHQLFEKNKKYMKTE